MAAFPEVQKIKYEGRKSKNPLAFRHYDENEQVAGKTMKDQLRFSVAYWHTMRGSGGDPFGPGTMLRPWEAADDSVDNAIHRVRVGLRVHGEARRALLLLPRPRHRPRGQDAGRDQPEPRRGGQDRQAGDGADRQSSCSGARPTCSATPATCTARPPAPTPTPSPSPPPQVKKALEVTKELGGAGYVFWGGREGYQTLWNTDMKRELDHLARFMHMAVDYAKQIGFNGQFYFEPKPKEPTKHQYDFDAAACINFLRAYGLADHVKLNIETNHATLAGHTVEHELDYAGSQGFLGSVDANTGDLLLGWDTDQFPTDVYLTTKIMLVILKYGGFTTRRAELRRQGPPREFRADRPVLRPRRRHGRLCQGPADRRRDPGRRRVGPDGQGPLRLVGRAAWAPRSRPASRISPRWRSTCSARATSRPTRAAGRSCSRTS